MDDPEWMNEFQTPTENVLMDLSSSSPSSSPSPEKITARKKGSGTEEEISISNGKELSDDEDSPLLSAHQYFRAGKKGRKGFGGGISLSQEAEKLPAKLSAKGVRKKTVGAQDVNAEDSPNVELRLSRRKNKRALEFEEEDADYEYQVPSKVPKTSGSSQVNKDSPSFGRKGRRVSFSDCEGTPQLEKGKMEAHLGDSEPIDEEDNEPISSLVSKKDKKATTAATTTGLSVVLGDDSKVGAKKEPSAFGLAALRHPGGTAVDGEDPGVTQEEASQGEIGEISERKGKQRGSSSLPVVLSEKVHRTKVLLECEGDALDLSGDMGAVGRFSVDSVKENGDEDLFLDLKGIIYKTTIVPSNTFFVVNVGHAEAKVEAIMNDFMQLRPDVNQVEDETVVEGTLEGFAFDLDNDGEPLSTPLAAAGSVDSDPDEETKKKKKTSINVQKQKKVTTAGGKSSRAKAAGKGGMFKKQRARAKLSTKKFSKTKPSAAKGIKSKKS